MTLAVLCPGQGAQHPALFDQVDEHVEGTRMIDDAAQALGDDPRDWLKQGDAIYRNAIAQPLICTAQLAQWATLRSQLQRPTALAGYSVGELACYGVSGALDIGELVRLARTRALAMDAAAASNPGGLIGVRGLSRPALHCLCEENQAFIAITTADDAFVVGGSDAVLVRMRQRCESAGAKVTDLRVGIASHTPLLDGATEQFRIALERSTLTAPPISVIASIDAGLVTTRERGIATLSSQISHTVEWVQCLDALHERGCRVFLELGPGRALSRMLRDRFDDVEARAVDEFRDSAGVVRWVQRKMSELG
ncbi:MAG TPA: acyltransferase domain-containing protein [Casimicrobiaceae bacterium]|jgi:[acyl-carrier-protein] S-malonyltransferase